MNNTPLISILVAVYNVEKYIIECIDSIVSQTYKNIEIILVDDGSQDSSGKICDKFAEKDNRIKVIHTPNGGLSSARNYGIENAKGDFLIFVDGDDYISVEMTEKFYLSIIENNADIVIGGRLTTFESNKKNESIIFYQESGVINKNTIIKDLLDDSFSSHTWGKMYKASLWNNTRFTLGRVYGEDIASMHWIYHKASIISSVPESLYFYRVNDNSLSTTYRPFKWMSAYLAFKERLEFAKEYYPQFTAKLEAITLNFARLTYDNYILKKEKCDEPNLEEIIIRLMSSRRFVQKTPYIKIYNKVLILILQHSPNLYKRIIGYIHSLYYTFKPNNFR